MHYAETVQEVAELAQQHPTALMCSGSSPVGCHRQTLLTPSF